MIRAPRCSPDSTNAIAAHASDAVADGVIGSLATWLHLRSCQERRGSPGSRGAEALLESRRVSPEGDDTAAAAVAGTGRSIRHG